MKKVNGRTIPLSLDCVEKQSNEMKRMRMQVEKEDEKVKKKHSLASSCGLALRYSALFFFSNIFK